MDKATLLGFGIGFTIIGVVMAMGEGGHLSIGNMLLFCNLEAIIVTYGGALTAMLIAFPMKKFINLFNVTKMAFKEKLEDPVALAKQIIEMSTIARRDGVLALEESLTRLENPVLKQGIQMLVDGMASDFVHSNFELEIELLEKRHAVGHKGWEKLAYLGPAIGMVGTLIGLVKMLANLNDPSKIGGGMAVALLTTFYGALLANFFAIPLENKLSQKTNEEIYGREMILTGLMAIQAGDSPRVVTEKLKVFLSPKEREILEPKQ